MTTTIKAKNNLRNARLAKGLTQRQLAHKARLPESTTQRLDAPWAKLSLEQAVKLADALSIDVYDLLPG